MSVEKFSKLKRHLKKIHDIESAAAVLIWDQNTHLPPGGAPARGEQIGQLRSVAHELWTAKELSQLLDELSGYENSCGHTSFAASLIRRARRSYLQETCVPQDFVERFSEHVSQTYNAWITARPDNDFKRMIPYLEKTVALSQERAGFSTGFDHVADALIDLSDEGMTVAKLLPIFNRLQDELKTLSAQIEARQDKGPDPLAGRFDIAKQEKLATDIVAKLGYDFSRGRLDKTHHPFMIKFSNGDVRITTRYRENDITEAVFSTIHEAGHAMYEQGVAAELEGTLLAHGASSGVHESQSRLWENMVGRSLPFWQHFYPLLQNFFPEPFARLSLPQFYRGINRVERALIRTDADEVTYNLHVIIRFNLELKLLEGKLKVADLAEAWRESYSTALGVAPPDDRDGVLQDVHWYGDFIGGQFQGYTLGNVMAAQFFASAEKALPHLGDDLASGNFLSLRSWLTQNLYSHGAKYTADELLKQATGADLSVEPYLNYLKQKYLSPELAG